MFKVEFPDITIHYGDAMEILPTLGECADCVLTDPPYLLSSGGDAPEGSIAEWQLAEGYTNDGTLVTCNIDWPDFMPLIYKSMRGNSHCYTFANNRHIQAMLNEAEKAGLRFHNLLCWDKGTATPNRWGMKNIEYIGFFFKGKAKHWNDCGAKQLIYVAQENYMLHPTVKPVGLLENYIRQSTKEGETILDPFCGTGSTLLAAVKSGRKAIGIELEEKWFKASVKRINDFYNQPRQLEML